MAEAQMAATTVSAVSRWRVTTKVRQAIPRLCEPLGNRGLRLSDDARGQPGQMAHRAYQLVLFETFILLPLPVTTGVPPAFDHLFNSYYI